MGASKISRQISTVVRLFLQGLVFLYRVLISPWTRSSCRFLPTCSEYAMQALKDHGPWRGSLLTIKRISRCHPWGKHGIDPVPPRSGKEKQPLRKKRVK